MQLTEDDRVLFALKNYLMLLTALYNRAELTTDRKELFISSNDIREILKTITPTAYYEKIDELKEKKENIDE